jgi:hypothetical protein
MGRINQAMVQDRLLMGSERVPLILLLTFTALGVVIDYDIGLVDTLVAGVVFGTGLWILRGCAAYDPRLFANLLPKIWEFSGQWSLGHRGGRRRWSVGAAPLHLKSGPYRLRGRGAQGTQQRPTVSTEECADVALPDLEREDSL